jgi:hypothetical protein
MTWEAGRDRLEGEKLSDRVRVVWRSVVEVVGVVGRNEQNTEMLNLLRAHAG